MSPVGSVQMNICRKKSTRPSVKNVLKCPREMFQPIQNRRAGRKATSLEGLPAHGRQDAVHKVQQRGRVREHLKAAHKARDHCDVFFLWEMPNVVSVICFYSIVRRHCFLLICFFQCYFEFVPFQGTIATWMCALAS